MTERTVHAVIALVPRGDGSFGTNLEGVWEDKLDAIKYADDLFTNFQGRIGIKVLAAGLNDRESVGPVYVRDATIPAGTR
jgi:hypothetical protein